MEIFCPVARLTTKYSAGHASMNSLTRDLAPSSVPSTLKMSNGRSICQGNQTTDRERRQGTEHTRNSLPGILGAASFVDGIALFVTARRKDEPDPKYKVK